MEWIGRAYRIAASFNCLHLLTTLFCFKIRNCVFTDQATANTPSIYIPTLPTHCHLLANNSMDEGHRHKVKSTPPPSSGLMEVSLCTVWLHSLWWGQPAGQHQQQIAHNTHFSSTQWRVISKHAAIMQLLQEDNHISQPCDAKAQA